MYISDFDTYATYMNLLDQYKTWWAPGSALRMFTPGSPGSGLEFYNKQESFYFHLLHAEKMLYLFYSNPSDLTEAGNIAWNGSPSSSWSELPPFITSSPAWLAADQSNYDVLRYGPGLTLDEACIKAESIFEKTISIYEQWLLDNGLNDDMGVLNSYDTRIKSTHYWAIYMLFQKMCKKWIPVPPMEGSFWFDAASEYHPPVVGIAGNVPYFPPLTVPQSLPYTPKPVPPVPFHFLLETINDLQNRISALEKKAKKGAKKKSQR